MEAFDPAGQTRDATVARLTLAMTNGSDDAYQQFYNLIFDRLYRLLLSQTRGDEHLTRELIQAVLLRVLKYIQPFQREAQLWAWLRQIARSAHVDWLRRNGKHLEVQSLEIIAQAEAPAPGDSESDEELLLLLEQSLSGLQTDERELIRLIYFEHLPQRTLAEKWQTTAKAIESKLARVRQKLRATLLERMNDHVLL